MYTITLPRLITWPTAANSDEVEENKEKIEGTERQVVCVDSESPSFAIKVLLDTASFKKECAALEDARPSYFISAIDFSKKKNVSKSPA